MGRNYFFIEVYLIYNIVLVSGVQNYFFKEEKIKMARYEKEQILYI